MSCPSSHPRETEPEMRIRVQVINYGSASRVGRSGRGQDSEEEEAKQGCDFRWSPSLSMILWGALERKSHSRVCSDFGGKGARLVSPHISQLLAGSQRMGIFPGTCLTDRAAHVPKVSPLTDNGAFSSTKYRDWGTGARGQWEGLGRGASGPDK